jgi:hypothetical protein
MDPSRVQITRQHVLDLLPLMGQGREQEARLLALHHPVDVAAAAFTPVGVAPDILTDRTGGSP